ncbi:MAG TPA: NmrA family NAD(P)-binding protein [Thermoanaerobaculia bacterium]|jgi:uncharacterized protein YbjT (DUF2867 family)|nr:NmrA family NAD(P)-binding protein [Thermoanaerobaculia bacterium]
MSGHIVVTGATGHVGGGIAEALLGRGIAVKAVGRSADRLASLVGKGAEAAVGSVEDAAFLEQTFAGARAVFVMVPPDYHDPEISAKQQRIVEAYGQALRKAGVTHVVALSSFGAEQPSGTGPIVSVHHLENALKAIDGLHSVSLRAGYFMENHLWNIGLIKGQGINGSTVRGDVPVPQVATRDIAAVAAGLLGDLAFTGATVRYVLGPKDVTLAEATSILGRAVGKPELPYVQFDQESARQGMLGAGLPAPVAELFLEMESALNDGLLAAAPRSAENTTPTTLEQFVADTFVPAFGA